MNIVHLQQYPDHIPTVAKWLYDEWVKYFPDGSLSRAEKILKLTPDDTELPISFLALQNGEPAGLARLVRYDMTTRRELTPWLSGVYVPVQFRNSGIGTELCKIVVNEATHLGFPSIYLFTPDRESFYTRQGWTTIEYTIYRNDLVVVMQIQTRDKEQLN